MRVHDLRSRTIRALAVAGILAATMSVGITSSSAAGILPTTTTVVSSNNPALAGSDVTLTATVKILNTNLGPITPKGTVTFTVDNVQVGAPVPLSSCIILLTQCTATKVITAGPHTWEGSVVKATFNGDTLSKPSTGTLTQFSTDPVICEPNESGCDVSADAANGLSSIYVSPNGTSPNELTLTAYYQTARLACGTAGTGDTAVFNIEGDPSVSKTVNYVLSGSAATAGNADLFHVCWESDSAFPGSTLQSNGSYQGTLPQCNDGGNPPPCVESASYYDSEGVYLYMTISAPAGDPKVLK